MKNETKLTAQDLALYLGCEASALPDNGIGIFRGIDISGWAEIEIPEIGLFTTNYFSLILRPLSDMTEDEEKEFVPLCAGSQIARFSRDQSGASNWRQWLIEFENGDVDYLVMNESGETWFRSYFEHTDHRQNFSNIVNQHKQTDWLRRHWFDTENWIPAGLAIDKTKIETK